MGEASHSQTNPSGYGKWEKELETASLSDNSSIFACYILLHLNVKPNGANPALEIQPMSKTNKCSAWARCLAMSSISQSGMCHTPRRVCLLQVGHVKELLLIKAEVLFHILWSTNGKGILYHALNWHSHKISQHATCAAALMTGE